jgi:hypothetical protein
MGNPVAAVQFSTGIGSGEVAYRAVAKYGKDRTVLLTADTLREDEDNWRYGEQVWRDLGEPEWLRLTDGRTPMQVGRDRSCVPSNRMPVCSQELKVRLLRSYIDGRWQPGECVVLLGFDWTEEGRYETAKPNWVPHLMACPLMDAPWRHKAQLLDNSRTRGIEPPRLYKLGWSHANCGGCCVRGGQAAWKRALFQFPERYAMWEVEEDQRRVELGKDVAILRERSGPNEGRALPLRTFRERVQSIPSLFDSEDEGACGCTVGVMDPAPTERPPPMIHRRTIDGWFHVEQYNGESCGS